MLASYKYRFIFIKTKRTAGTSIEMALSELCGPDDIVSPIGRRLGLERAARGIFPRNFGASPEIERRYLDALKARDSSLMAATVDENRRVGGIDGHAFAATIKQRVGDDFWSKAFKFTPERHPYEKAMSLACLTYPRAKGTSFAEHLNKIVLAGREYPGHPRYMIDGRCVVDAFVRQERLLEDLEAIRLRLGLPSLSVARTKKPRQDQRPAKEVLSDEQKSFIYQRCKPEFDLLGWEP